MAEMTDDERENARHRAAALAAVEEREAKMCSDCGGALVDGECPRDCACAPRSCRHCGHRSRSHVGLSHGCIHPVGEGFCGCVGWNGEWNAEPPAPTPATGRATPEEPEIRTSMLTHDGVRRGRAATPEEGTERRYTLAEVADMLDAESRRIVGPPADVEDAVHRAEKSFGYWAAAKWLRDTTPTPATPQPSPAKEERPDDR